MAAVVAQHRKVDGAGRDVGGGGVRAVACLLPRLATWHRVRRHGWVLERDARNAAQRVTRRFASAPLALLLRSRLLVKQLARTLERPLERLCFELGAPAFTYQALLLRLELTKHALRFQRVRSSLAAQVLGSDAGQDARLGDARLHVLAGVLFRPAALFVAAAPRIAPKHGVRGGGGEVGAAKDSGLGAIVHRMWIGESASNRVRRRTRRTIRVPLDPMRLVITGARRVLPVRAVACLLPRLATWHRVRRHGWVLERDARNAAQRVTRRFASAPLALLLRSRLLVKQLARTLERPLERLCFELGAPAFTYQALLLRLELTKHALRFQRVRSSLAAQVLGSDAGQDARLGDARLHVLAGVLFRPAALFVAAAPRIAPKHGVRGGGGEVGPLHLWTGLGITDSN